MKGLGSVGFGDLMLSGLGIRDSGVLALGFGLCWTVGVRHVIKALERFEESPLKVILKFRHLHFKMRGLGFRVQVLQTKMAGHGGFGNGGVFGASLWGSMGKVLGCRVHQGFFLELLFPRGWSIRV